MATRLYFSSTAVPAKSPGFAAWTRTSEAVRRTMSTVKDGSSLTGTTFFANTSPAANASCLAVQFVSPPLAAGIAFSTTDTFSGVIKCLESATNDNINRLPIALKVYAADGTTLQATLKALGHYGPNTTEWPTTAATKILGNAVVLGANYTTAAGDLLVLEIGGQVDATGGNTVTGTQTIGSAAASDYALTEALTTSLNPWFEVSRTLTFLFTGSAAVTHGPRTASGTGTFRTLHTASAAVSHGPLSATGNATFSAPPVSASAAVSHGALTATGSGLTSGPHPVGILTRFDGAIAGRRTGSFAGKPNTPPYSEGTAAVSIGALTAAGTALHSGPHPVGKLTQWAGGISQKRYGTFQGKGGSAAAAAVSLGAHAAAGTASFTAPVYTGTAAVSHGAMAAAGSALFVSPVYSGGAAVALGGHQSAGTALTTTPTYAGIGSAALGGHSAAGTGLTAASIFVGTAFLLTGPRTATGSATFVSPEYTGVVFVVRGPTSASGTALVSVPVYNGTAAVVRSRVVATGTASTALGPPPDVNVPAAVFKTVPAVAGFALAPANRGFLVSRE